MAASVCCLSASFRVNALQRRQIEDFEVLGTALRGRQNTRFAVGEAESAGNGKWENSFMKRHLRVNYQTNFQPQPLSALVLTANASCWIFGRYGLWALLQPFAARVGAV
jgi:hypothetical protein